MKKTNEVLSIEKGRVYENLTVEVEALDENKKLFSVTESKEEDKKGKIVLKPRIEAIHSGMTRNKTFYVADRLKGDPIRHSGVFSWTHPYPKPMIKNHNHNSEPTGRIENAMYVTNSASGKESIVIVPTITDPETIEKILDGRYLTVSIGAETDAAICSICGTNLVEEGWCGHHKGEFYDGQECYWILGDLWFDECSWVNVPSDQDAQIIEKGEAVVVEAFAETEEGYYNLSKDKSDKGYVLTEQVAETYGLVTNKENTLPEDSSDGSGKEGEGKGKMTDPKKKPEQTEETVNTEENLDTQKTEEGFDEAPEPSDVEQASKKTEAGSSKTQEGAEDSKVKEQEEQAEGQDTSEAVSQEVLDLKQRVEALQVENQTLLENNTDLSAQLHKLLVERVVDLRISLKKPGTEDREAAIESFMGRTYESLQDSLNDLLGENTTSARRSPEEGVKTVENPAGGAVDGEKNQKIVESDGNTETTNKAKKLNKEQVLKNLFSGNQLY